MMHLIIDNTLPCDLPDLYEGIESNVPAFPDVSIAFMLGGLAYRLSRIAFWIMLGLVAGVLI